MRPKVVITVLLLGLAGVAAIYFLKPAGSRPPAEVAAASAPVAPPAKVSPTVLPQPVTPSVVAPVATPAPVKIEVAPSEPTNTAPVAAVAVNAEAAAVQAKINRLEELQANYDAESLREILGELINTNRDIRHAAIEATTQFRDRAAIPVLAELAAQTSNPQEKQELLDAVEFLKLPTYTEVMAQKRLAAQQQRTGQP